MLVHDARAYDASGACTNGVPNADNVLKGLDSQKVVVVRLNFVRNFGGQELQVAFTDSFKANTVDRTAPAIDDFLSLVHANVRSGDAWTIAIEKGVDGNDSLAFQNADGIVTKIVGTDLIRRIMSLWIGRPAFGEAKSNLTKLLCGT
jgi:hypothetical protein